MLRRDPPGARVVRRRWQVEFRVVGRRPPPASRCRGRSRFEPDGRALRRRPGTLMDHRRRDLGRRRGCCGARSWRPPARRLAGPARRGAGPDPLDRRSGDRRRRRAPDGDPALAACELWEAELDEDRRAAAGRRGRAPLAAAQPAAPAGAPGARPRRLPARQPDRRRVRPGGGDRLGAVPLAATRPRTSAGSASARGASATTISRWRAWVRSDELLDAYEAAGGEPPGCRAAAVVGGDRQRQVGGDLRPPGARPPDGPRPTATSWPRSDAASASPSGTSSSWSTADGVTQDRPDGARAARRAGRVSLFRGPRVGAARGALPGAGARQPVRGPGAGAARRRGAARGRTWSCSRDSGAGSPRPTTGAAARQRERRWLAATPARRAGRAPRRRSPACASTSRRKLEVARPGTRLSAGAATGERERVQRAPPSIPIAWPVT